LQITALPQFASDKGQHVSGPALGDVEGDDACRPVNTSATMNSKLVASKSRPDPVDIPVVSSPCNATNVHGHISTHRASCAMSAGKPDYAVPGKRQPATSEPAIL
jgi:hypothetical protein